MLLGQPPGGWQNAPWTGTAAGSAMPAFSALDRFGPYRLQPYSLPPAVAMPTPASAQPVALALPAAIEAWRQQQLQRWAQIPRFQPIGGRPAAMQQYAAMQHPQAAHLLYLNQQAAQRRPPGGVLAGRRGGPSVHDPRRSGGGGWHEPRGPHGNPLGAGGNSNNGGSV